MTFSLPFKAVMKHSDLQSKHSLAAHPLHQMMLIRTSEWVEWVVGQLVLWYNVISDVCEATRLFFPIIILEMETNDASNCVKEMCYYFC